MIIAAVVRTNTVTQSRAVAVEHREAIEQVDVVLGYELRARDAAPGPVRRVPMFAGFWVVEGVGSAIGRYSFGLIGLVGTRPP